MSTFLTPPNDPRNLPHWEGAKRGVLLLQRCKDCGHFSFPATSQCAKCHLENSEWVEASGYATVESFCTFHKAYWPELKANLPYSVIQVELEEGVSFISNITGLGHPDELKIGMHVKACFEAITPDLTLVRFSPVN
jgi:uncharacterized OB-fold protein